MNPVPTSAPESKNEEKRTTAELSAESYLQEGVLYEADGNLEAAIQCWNTAIAEGLKDARIHGCLGKALYNQGKITEAISQFETSIQVNPENDIYEMLADCYPGNQNSHVYLTATASLNDDAAWKYYCILAGMYYDPWSSEWSVQNSIDLLLGAMQRYQDPALQCRLRCLLAKGYRCAENNSEAITVLQQALTMDSKIDDELSSEVHYELGLSYKAMRQVKEAILFFKKAVEFKVSVPKAVDLCRAYLDECDFYMSLITLKYIIEHSTGKNDTEVTKLADDLLQMYGFLARFQFEDQEVAEHYTLAFNLWWSSRYIKSPDEKYEALQREEKLSQSDTALLAILARQKKNYHLAQIGCYEFLMIDGYDKVPLHLRLEFMSTMLEPRLLRVNYVLSKEAKNNIAHLKEQILKYLINVLSYHPQKQIILWSALLGSTFLGSLFALKKSWKKPSISRSVKQQVAEMLEGEIQKYGLMIDEVTKQILLADKSLHKKIAEYKKEYPALQECLQSLLQPKAQEAEIKADKQASRFILKGISNNPVFKLKPHPKQPAIAPIEIELHEMRSSSLGQKTK